MQYVGRPNRGFDTNWIGRIQGGSSLGRSLILSEQTILEGFDQLSNTALQMPFSVSNN